MKNYKKVIAAATAIAISAAATGSIAYAKNNDKTAAPAAKTENTDTADTKV